MRFQEMTALAHFFRQGKKNVLIQWTNKFCLFGTFFRKMWIVQDLKVRKYNESLDLFVLTPCRSVIWLHCLWAKYAAEVWERNNVENLKTLYLKPKTMNGLLKGKFFGSNKRSLMVGENCGVEKNFGLIWNNWFWQIILCFNGYLKYFNDYLC